MPVPVDSVVPRPRLGVDEFSTGQIARVLCIAPRSASKLIDSGRIPGHRFPGGEDRRVLRQDLVAFCRNEGLVAALHRLGEPTHVVQTFGLPSDLEAGLSARLPEEKVIHHGTRAGLGWSLASSQTDVLVLGPCHGRHAVGEVRQWLVSRPMKNYLRVLVLGGEEVGDWPGADLYMPCPAEVLAARVLDSIGPPPVAPSVPRKRPVPQKGIPPTRKEPDHAVTSAGEV